MFCYIELTLLNKTVQKVFFGGAFVMSVCNGRLQNAPTQHTAKAIDYQGMGLSEKFFCLGVYNGRLQNAPT